jgi:hypothetical protein
MEIDKKIKADIAFLLELQKHKVEKTPNGGWDINLFKSSFFNKIKALHKKGEQESVNSILNYFESKNKELGLPNVFTSNHAIWKLRDFVPFEKEVEESKKPDNEFNYMMLSRLKSDCDYFLGYGNRSEQVLARQSVKEHIEAMKELWNNLPENGKPEWLSMEDILDYENKLTDKPMEEKKYELGYGSKGNGTTVWNRLDMDKKTNDYKTIAHISNEGEVKFYDKDLPKSVIDEIKQHSIGLKITKEEVLEPNTSDEFYDVIFAQIEPHYDWYGNLMKERHIKRQIAKLIKSNGNEPSNEEVEEIFNVYKNRYIKENDIQTAPQKEPEFEVGQTVFYEDGGYKWLGAVEDVEEIDGNYFYRINAFAKKSNLQILNTPAETNIKAENDIKSDDSKDMDFKLYKLVDEFTDQLKDKSTLITPEQVAIVQPEWDKMQEFLNEGKAEEIDKLKIVKPFFGKGQYEVVKSNLSSYEEVIDDLYSIITTMPKTYETDGIPKLEKIAYLHYFTSSSDWYILEKDMESDQRQAFGFVILNGDMQFAELGYVDIEEVKKYAELDFYFDPKTLLEVTSDQVEEKPIEILQPLSQENPLSSQLKALTGDGYNWSDYTGENGEEVTSGGVIVHKKTGRRFKVPSKFNYFKGIENDYSNQFNLNKGIEEFLDSKDENYIFSDQEKSFLYLYEGYGGLEKEGATGNVLLWEYYTPQLLIKKMWGLANKYGFNHGKVLEPSVGVGRFLDFSEGSNVTAYEINPYSARICRILHPKANVKLRSFEEHFYNGNTFNPKCENNFDLVIGNPPYGDNTGKRSVAESKRLKVAVRKWEHYFILRGLDTLKSGGLLVYVSTANLFTKGYEPLKEKISERAELVDAYLLPNKTFKRTQINTSLIVLRKK